MKRIHILTFIALTATILGSCAKNVTEGTNEANQRYFDAWIAANAPNTERVGRGIYVYPESVEEGTGIVVEKDGFAICRYTCTDLEGNITSYTDEDVARQLGEYSPSSYYGIRVMTTTDETIRAGVSDAIIGMKAGGKKKFIVPTWLMVYSNYPTEEEYLKKSSDQASSIYDIEIVDFTKNISNWELLQIEKCFKKPDFFNGAFNSTSIADSTSQGFYFKMLNKVESGREFPKDTTIYINYTGSLLDLEEFSNGLVFDTSIENVAKDNDLYSSSKTYKAMAVKWAEKHSELTLGGSNVVSGFSQTLWNMANCGTGTKAVGVFYSPLGYSYNGSGSIPAYAPLVFEIEIVDKPE
jgi:FKBP-type peptidyl-prolyl cis-trans isomerase